MAKKKIEWIKAKAFLIYDHPFEDRPHLRRRIIRWPAYDRGSNFEVWSETFNHWLPITRQRIFRIYHLLN
jgi:hypothetical protein